MPVTVVLVDPQPFFCEALAVALAPEAVVVGWTGDEISGAELVERERPDLVLTEVELVAGSGFGLARRVGDAARVVLLTRREEGDVLLDALEAGAHGVLGHATRLTHLRAVLEGAAGQSWVSDPARLRTSLHRAQASQREVSGGRLGRLTAREREVLQLLARGLARDAIASSLYLSEHTVRTHLGNILKKLGVHSQAEAARVALRAGFGTSDVHVVRISGPDLPRPEP